MNKNIKNLFLCVKLENDDIHQVAITKENQLAILSLLIEMDENKTLQLVETKLNDKFDYYSKIDLTK